MATVDFLRYQEYIVGCVATILLKQKFKESYPTEENKDPFNINMRSRLEHGRGGPKLETTLKTLESANIINSFYRSDINHSFYGKPDYRYFLKVNRKWYEKYSKSIETEPKFELQETIKEYRGYTKERAPFEKDGYKEITSFKPGETTYILNHIDDYSFVKGTKTHTFVKGTKKYYNTHTFVLCYPKEQRAELAKEVFDAHVKAYLKEHFEWVVKLLFGIEENVINRDTPNMFGAVSHFDNVDKWTKDKVRHKIDLAIATQEYLCRSIPVLKQIEKALEEYKDIDIFEEGFKKFKEYLTESYPCHLNDKDDKLKQLAEWMVYGKHKGTYSDVNVA